ncbi:TetR family transcriptional regulator [Sphaerisporangium rhizosphaerae]|uniref:TetR family transcriptional regulator n=1 Tax=Sphaerisporangium rhizosphaerae TaxID=2269375 RepID=A0ABW2PG38_9ACTN
MSGTRERQGGRAGQNAQETRRRILSIAQELFAEQGYAGTSIADIAGRLGTSKAALYYHFASKAEIIEALMAEPLLAYQRLADAAISGRADAGELLGAVIDTTAELHTLIDLIGGDPSARAALQRVVPRSQEINAALTAALTPAGPDAAGPDAAGVVRAYAAYAVAKNGTLALLSAGDGALTPAERSGLLAAALRALHG